MSSTQTRVLVTGATGNQGGAVVDHLLDSEAAFDVRGLTRDAAVDVHDVGHAAAVALEDPEDKEGTASVPGWVKATR